MANDDNPVPPLVDQLDNAFGQFYAQLNNAFSQFYAQLDSFTDGESMKRRTDREMLGRMSEKVLEIEELIRTRLDNSDQPPVGSDRASSMNSRQATLDRERDTGAEQEWQCSRQ